MKAAELNCYLVLKNVLFSATFKRTWSWPCKHLLQNLCSLNNCTSSDWISQRYINSWLWTNGKALSGEMKMHFVLSVNIKSECNNPWLSTTATLPHLQDCQALRFSNGVGCFNSSTDRGRLYLLPRNIIMAVDCYITVVEEQLVTVQRMLICGDAEPQTPSSVVDTTFYKKDFYY